MLLYGAGASPTHDMGRWTEDRRLNYARSNDADL
jgi:hypothetical protein